MQLGETFFCFRELCQQLLFLLFIQKKNPHLLLKNPSELEINLSYFFFTLILCSRERGGKKVINP